MYFRLISAAVILAVLISAGLYVKHLYRESQRVPNLVQTINLLEKQKTQEREAAQKALKDNDEIRKNMAAIDSRSAALARRLRNSLSKPPQTTPGPSSPSGTSGDGSGSGPSDDDISALLGACQKDALRLNAWIEYYRSIPAELK